MFNDTLLVKSRRIDLENQGHTFERERVYVFFGFRIYPGIYRFLYSFSVWWIVAVVVSVIGCIIAILNVWNTWTTRPVIMTFDDKNTPISKIPFPAVTICTTQKITENLTRVGENAVFEELFPGE